MLLVRNIRLPLTCPDPDAEAAAKALAILRVPARRAAHCGVAKLSVDARHGTPVLVYTIAVTLKDEGEESALAGASPCVCFTQPARFSFSVGDTALKTRPVVVGLGPAGLFAALLLACVLLCACSACKKESPPAPEPAQSEPASAVSWDDLTFDRTLPLQYATQFSVSYAGEDYTRLTIGDDQTFLVVAGDAPVPDGVPADVTVLTRPLSHIYLVATAAMDYFRQLDAIDAIALSGQKEADWYIDEAKAAMQAGTMVYAGKYSAPDYETILAAGCDLAIENTMIYHTPEVIEQLVRIGVPVLIERSSYEPEPLGRMEWLKLYAALLGREDAACAYYDDLIAALAPVLDQEPTGQTVAFFYITTSGAVNVRKSGDYIAKAIRMAGGEYVSFDESGEENALSTMTIQMESFYDTALDADVLIYNSTIDGGITSIDELLAKSPLFADFKAVQTGNVWCITKNFYQESLALGDMILDVHAVLNDKDAGDLRFLRKLS